MSTGILLGQGGGSSIPAGLICMWSGSSSNIPNGWALCNGSDNTPDLRDKFVLGAGNNYAVGATGGEKEVTLTVAQIPNHNHDIGNHTHNIERYYYSTSGSSNYTMTSAGTATVIYGRYNESSWNVLPNTRAGSISGETITSSVGEGKSHNNMPPYYALCFIMKL